MRLIHCSDLHFLAPQLSKEFFFSKQLLSFIFHLFGRGARISNKSFSSLGQLWRGLGASKVLIAGDCTTLASNKEYDRFELFGQKLAAFDLKVMAIPGNHDFLTANSKKEARFYNSKYSHKEPLFSCPLSDKWELIGIDAARPTPFFKAFGKIDHDQLERLREILCRVPQDKKLLILCHFPLVDQGGLPSKHLKGSKELLKLLQEQGRPYLYLTGHTHRQHLFDGRGAAMPVQINSGSLRFPKGASWNLIDLSENGSAAVEFWRYQKGATTWKRSHRFELGDL